MGGCGPSRPERNGAASGRRTIETTATANASAPMTSIALRMVLFRACVVAPRKKSESAKYTV
jgi:hypothetical protein